MTEIDLLPALTALVKAKTGLPAANAAALARALLAHMEELILSWAVAMFYSGDALEIPVTNDVSEVRYVAID